MKTGTQADLIRYLLSEHGIDIKSRNSISKLVKNKDYRIIKTTGGKIKIEETAKVLVDSGFGKRSEMIKRKKQKQPVKTPQIKAPTPEEHAEDLKESGPLKITDSRQRIENHKAFQQAEKFRIENEKNLDKLIDIVDVGDKSFNLWRQVRDEIQAIKDRIAIKVRSADSDHEAEQIVHDETHRILTSIISGYENLDEPGLKKKLLQRLIR